MNTFFRFLVFYYERANLHLYKSRFVGCLMTKGKRGVAERVYNDIFFLLKNRGRESPLLLFSQAVVNIRPLVYLKPRKLGGTIHYFANPVSGERKKAIFTAICLFSSIRSVRRTPGFGPGRVAEILYDASKNKGLAVEEKMGIYWKASNIF